MGGGQAVGPAVPGGKHGVLGRIEIMVRNITLQPHGYCAVVVLHAGDFGTRLRLQKIGNGDGGQYPDDGDHNEQFNQSKRFVHPFSPEGSAMENEHLFDFEQYLIPGRL